MDLCSDLINLICGNLTDKSTTRLLRTCKQLQSMSFQVPLKDEHDCVLSIAPNCRYKIKNGIYKNNIFVKNIVGESITNLILYRVEYQIGTFPTNLIHLKVVKCKKINLPKSIEMLTIKNSTFCMNFIDFEQLKYMDIDDCLTIENFPPYLKVLKYTLERQYYYIPKLPTTLLALKIFNGARWCVFPQSFALDTFLPPNLKNLHLTIPKYEPFNENIVFPETLEILYLDIGERHRLSLKLPKNVKYLHMEEKYFDLSLNISLKYVSLGIYLDRETIDYLPDCVETIEVSHHGIYNITYFPKNLNTIYNRTCFPNPDNFPSVDNRYIIKNGPDKNIFL